MSGLSQVGLSADEIKFSASVQGASSLRLLSFELTIFAEFDCSQTDSMAFVFHLNLRVPAYLLFLHNESVL